MSHNKSPGGANGSSGDSPSHNKSPGGADGSSGDSLTHDGSLEEQAFSFPISIYECVSCRFKVARHDLDYS